MVMPDQDDINSLDYLCLDLKPDSFWTPTLNNLCESSMYCYYSFIPKVMYYNDFQNNCFNRTPIIRKMLSLNLCNTISCKPPYVDNESLMKRYVSFFLWESFPRCVSFLSSEKINPHPCETLLELYEIPTPFASRSNPTHAKPYLNLY